MGRTLYLVHVLVACLVLGTCGSREKTADEDWVATVGQRSITVAAFQQAYLPVVLYGDTQDSPETRAELLDVLITRKILAQEAEKIQLDTTGLVQRIADIAERKAMAKLLYREWVQQRIAPPTQQELREAFVRGRTRLLVRHLAVATKPQADTLYQALLSGSATFEEIASDIFEDVQLRYSGGLLGWVTFGDLDVPLENVVFNLKPGTPSEPVRSLYGWHILRVDDARRQVAFDQGEFDRQRKNLETKVYRRHELRTGRQVLNDYMSSKNVAFNKEIAEQVWDILRPRLHGSGERRLLVHPEFMDLNREDFGSGNQSLLGHILVSFDGGSWTVAAFLDRLPDMKREYLTGNLYIGTMYLIRDELLAREGYARGHDRDPAVVRQVEDAKDQVLERLYLETILDTTTVTPSSVKRYYEGHWEHRYYGLDSLLLQEILVADETEADRMMLQIRQGKPFAELALQHGSNTGALRPEGYLGWQVAGKTDYPVLYREALRARLNVPLGPIDTPRGWSIIRAVARHRYPAPYEEVKDRVREDLERDLYEEVRNRAAEQGRPNYRVAINQKLLHSL